MRAPSTVFAVTLLLGLACGGGGGGGSTPASTFGSVQHSTWEAKRGQYRLQFKGSGKAVYTWRNMSGGAVPGNFTEAGDDVHVVWEPVDHMGSREFKLTRTGKCSLAMHWRLSKEGEEVEMSTVYERSTPKCED